MTTITRWYHNIPCRSVLSQSVASNSTSRAKNFASAFPISPKYEYTAIVLLLGTIPQVYILVWWVHNRLLPCHYPDHQSVLPSCIVLYWIVLYCIVLYLYCLRVSHVHVALLARSYSEAARTSARGAGASASGRGECSAGGASARASTRRAARRAARAASATGQHGRPAVRRDHRRRRRRSHRIPRAPLGRRARLQLNSTRAIFSRQLSHRLSLRINSKWYYVMITDQCDCYIAYFSLCPQSSFVLMVFVFLNFSVHEHSHRASIFILYT